MYLVAANHSQQFITLNFRNMGTECSYDYVFVYDGDSFRSPLLGSFSGKTEPQQVMSTSGYVSESQNNILTILDSLKSPMDNVSHIDCSHDNLLPYKN